ncbi:MAG: 4-(cytidine 5'-diphospho)-2-C-methyl-D-erythritol kinase [Spirochaetota bacterium]|nr:4-(cytidine 5'-diphospho)-2-C-methyl-D-erythritol kinase [Spirochaetota bacterium]
MNWKSYAKINLFLDITGKRDDGYHTIDTVFLMVSLHDSIVLSENDELEDGEIAFDCDIEELNSRDNLIWKAIELMRPYIPSGKKGITLKLNKVIPFGAGLGGGSSNAASAMLLLRKHFNIDIDDKALMRLGSRLGADVPFFVRGGIARGRGIGDELNYYDGLIFPYHFIIIKPPIHASTQEAYQGLLSVNPQSNKSLDELLQGIQSGDLDSVSKNLYNKFEESQFARYPVLKELKDKLLACGACGALMSGSGSALFAIYRTKEMAEAAFKSLNDKDNQVFMAEAVIN